jgi:iron complex outermembrane recepter protein
MRIAYPACLTMLCVCASPAFAKDQVFNIPSQRLDTALIAMGEQAQISIGGVDPRLGGVRSRPVRGKMSVTKALSKMLRGTSFDFVAVDAATYRVVRAAPQRVTRAPKPPKPSKPSKTKTPPAISAAPPEPPAQEIIVTGSKQNQPLDSYPGTAHVGKSGYVGFRCPDADADVHQFGSWPQQDICARHCRQQLFGTYSIDSGALSWRPPPDL